jgi:hypothetical protein
VNEGGDCIGSDCEDVYKGEDEREEGGIRENEKEYRAVRGIMNQKINK